MIIITFNNWCLVNIFEMQCKSSCTASSWLVFQWNTNRPFFLHASHLCSIQNTFTAGTTKEMKMFSGQRVGQALCMAVSSCDSDEGLLQFSDLAGNSMCFVKRKKELRPHPFSWCSALDEELEYVRSSVLLFTSERTYTDWRSQWAPRPNTLVTETLGLCQRTKDKYWSK